MGSAGPTGASSPRSSPLRGMNGRAEIFQAHSNETRCSAAATAAAPGSLRICASSGAFPAGVSTIEKADEAPPLGRQNLAGRGSLDFALLGEDAVVPGISTAFAVPAATCAVSPVSVLATSHTGTSDTGHRNTPRRICSKQRSFIRQNSNKEADSSTGSKAKIGLLRGKTGRAEDKGASDSHSDSWTSSASEKNIQRDTRSHSRDLDMAHAGNSGRRGDDSSGREAVFCSGPQESEHKGRSLQVCLRRCVANLKKTWWPRLNRGMRIGAITTLALHLSVSKSLPGIGGILGQDWCINTYSLASTVLPEQSGAVISGLWVWVFTLACIAVLTFLLFPVLGFGAALGRVLCLLLFLLIVSWLSVMRLPLIYKVPPFDTDVNTHSLTSFAYLYIPYTTASVILSQQYRAFDTDLKTGLQFVVEMNTGVLLSSLLGWALFLLQVVLPPWSSQRHIVRVKLSRIMRDVAAAVSDISESFVQLRRILLSKNVQLMQGTHLNHPLDDLRVASHALQRSCQPLYTAIGSQTQLRVSIVASSTEPYLMYPGPAVFLFPFFARCCEVLIHNCMNVITLARHIDTLARDPLPVRLDADAALANILLRTEPLLCTTVTAYQLCAELMLVRPDTLHRAVFKTKLRAGLEQLDYIDKRVSATFGLLRSPSMQEVSSRQLATGDDVSVCLQRLLSRVSVGSNMGGSCPSETSAGYYPMSGVSATLERADHSLFRTWSQTGDFLPVRYSQGAERNQPLGGAPLETLLTSESSMDRGRNGAAAVPERKLHQRVRVTPFGGTPLLQHQRREAMSAAAILTAGAGATAAAAVQENPPREKSRRAGGARRWLEKFGLSTHVAPTGAGGYTGTADAHIALPAKDMVPLEKELRTAAAAAGLEVLEVDLGQTAADASSALPLGLVTSGPALSFATSSANTLVAPSAEGTAAAAAGAGAPSVAPGTAAVAATTESMEAGPVTTGKVAVGPTTAGGTMATRSRWGWEQGGGSTLKLELDPIAEEPEQHHGRSATTKTVEERAETRAHLGLGIATKETTVSTERASTAQVADDGHTIAGGSGGSSVPGQHPAPDTCVFVNFVPTTPTGAGLQAAETSTSDATAAAAVETQAAAAGIEGSSDSTRGLAKSASSLPAQPAVAGEHSAGHFGGERTTSTLVTTDAVVRADASDALTDKNKGPDSFYISRYDSSSSPAVSSSAPLSVPLHPTDSQSLLSVVDGVASSKADFLTSAASLSPSASPLSLPATAAATSAAHKFTRDALPGVSPPFLRGAFRTRSRSHPNNNANTPLLSADLDASDTVAFRNLPLPLRTQPEPAEASLVSATSRVDAVPYTAKIPSSCAEGAHPPVRATSFHDGSAALGSSDVHLLQVRTTSSPTDPPSVAGIAAAGRVPPAGTSPPVAPFVPVTPTAFATAPSPSTSTPCPGSSAGAQVAGLVPASDDALFERLFFPSLPTAELRVAAHDLASHRNSLPAGNIAASSEAPLGAVDTPSGAGGSASSAVGFSGGDSAARQKDTPALSDSSSTFPRMHLAHIEGSHIARDNDGPFDSSRSAWMSLFSLEKANDTGAAERCGSPSSRRSQQWQLERQQEGELPPFRPLSTQEPREVESLDVTPSHSGSLSPSTTSAESSMSSIDMDAVLTNLLQQSEENGPWTTSSGGEEESAEVNFRDSDTAILPDAAAAPSVISAPLTPAAASPRAPAASSPTVDANAAAGKTFYLQTASVPLTPAAPLAAPAVPPMIAGEIPPANISLAGPPAASAAHAGLTADATPTDGAAPAADLLIIAGGPVAAADRKSTMRSAAPESPVRAPVSEDLRKTLSVSRRSLTRLASTRRDEKESSKARTAAAAHRMTVGERASFAQEEEHLISPAVSVTAGDKSRSPQAAGVPSTPTGASAATAHGREDEKQLSFPVSRGEGKAFDEKASRVGLLETSKTISAAEAGAEEQRERTTIEETPALPSSKVTAGAGKQEKESLLRKQMSLRKRHFVFLRLNRKWKRTSAPWTWLARRVPWSLMSAQRRQRKTEEDLQALRALRQPSRGFGSSAAYAGAAGGGLAIYSTTAELRQELRISKLIVSLYRICAMDTQELCSTVRGLCLAVVSPSWEGARQNLKMMMLSLAMIFIQLFFGLRNLVRVHKWKWGGSEAFYRDVEAVHCMKLIFGLGFLFCCCLFYGPQIDSLLGVSKPATCTHFLDAGPHISGGPQTAKQWMILGFLCAHSFTYEGNTHKGIKRAVGTLLGGLAVELALMATSNYVLLLFLTFLSIVFVVFIFASPTEPASEFDKEFGYIGQVFIWTVTFILDIIWIYEGLVPFPYLRDTVVRSRICGNLVGIGFSTLLIYVPPVFSAERAARTYCATLLKTCRRCILLMNAAFLSLTTGKDKPEKPPDVQMRESTNDSTLASHSLLGPSPSPLTAINRSFHWARMWKFRRGRLGVPKGRDWRWMHKDREPQKDPKKAFHYYLQQAEELLRHHSTRLLVVARMLYDEGASSEHSPVWRVDKDIGEIMNRVEYLIMSVVDAVDNLCQFAMGTDPDLAALLHGSAVLARESVLTLLQQDRRNWERVMRCRAGKALLINMVRMVKAQSMCSHLLAKEIQAAGLHALDRIISWDWFRFPATMPPKYIRAVLRYIQGRRSVERYTNKVYESLAVCGRELREQGLFELDDWKGAIFSVLLIMEKCETRTYFMDEVHRFQLDSACKVVFGNEKPQVLQELLGSYSTLRREEEKEGREEACRDQRSPQGSLLERSFVRKTRAHSYPLRSTGKDLSSLGDEMAVAGERQERHISRRRSV